MQVSLCIQPFWIVCLPCLVVNLETFPLYYHILRDIKDLFLLIKALENMAQFRYVTGKFVANEENVN
jgi:hypothetical protein